LFAGVIKFLLITSFIPFAVLSLAHLTLISSHSDGLRLIGVKIIFHGFLLVYRTFEGLKENW